MSWEDTQLNKHLSAIDLADAKEQAIEVLSEQLSSVASTAIRGFIRSSDCYPFGYKNVNNATNGSDEFNEMFYKIAEKLINSVGG